MVDLHASVAQGDKEAARRIREAMDEPGDHLDNEEIDRLDELSVRLYAQYEKA